ncbi:hypothetical protein NQ318_000876 [Aromia moschata]|uniref:Uncharacterized protein n=1 Tax=Aromia moschata TaxID=1265417 RepID=A0AAV8ZFJ9_9CUCU|nr:hypothetical protein NQ318_000876 [Aromia moschata]
MEQRGNLKFLVKPGMYVYPAHKFLNGLKRDVKRPKTIRAPDGPQRQKRTRTLKKLAKPSMWYCVLEATSGREFFYKNLSVTHYCVLKYGSRGIDKECVRQILHESFNMHKVCVNMVPKLLIPEQKES